MQALKQSTATTIFVGPVLDASGLAITSAVLADFNLTKNGTSATLTGATVTHSHNGHYTIALTTGNTDTLGRLAISVNNSAMAMAPYRYTVLAAAAFDTLVTNGTLASTTSGRTIAVDASGQVTTGTLANNAITAAAIATDAGTEIATAVWSALTTTSWGTNSFGDQVLIGSTTQRSVLVTGSNHAAADVHEFQTNVIDSDALAASAVTEIQNGLATAASQTLILDSSNFNLCVLAGTIADAGTAGETYTITRNGSTYTIDFTGLDSTGNRTGQILTKT